MMYFLFTGTIPMRYFLFTGTVPVNNLFLFFVNNKKFNPFQLFQSFCLKKRKHCIPLIEPDEVTYSYIKVKPCEEKAKSLGKCEIEDKPSYTRQVMSSLICIRNFFGLKQDRSKAL